MFTANLLPHRGHIQSVALPTAEKSLAPPALPLRDRLTQFVARASRFAERPPAIRYSAALAAVFLALSVRLVLDPWFGDRGVYFTFLIAVILVSVCCGFGPSLLAALSGAALSTYFFVEPRYSLLNVTLDTQLPVLMGLSAAIMSSMVSEALRQTAVENERLFRLARESEIRKDEFLAMASHEIRSPLAPIRNALYYLRRAETTDEEKAAVNELLERQVELLVRLVDDLLDVSRITRGRIVLREESTPLSRIVENAVELARPLIDERGHKLTVNLPEELDWVRVDSVRMVQVIANLLNNAAKFSSWRGQIWLTAERTAKGELLIRVRDDGVGISAEMLPRIFDLFEQADRSTARTEGGMGVGLTVVKTIVELHGGSIQASSPGRTHGAEFTVRLPAHRVLGDAEPVRKPPPRRHLADRSQTPRADRRRQPAHCQ